jgi:hypothetical protein
MVKVYATNLSNKRSPRHQRIILYGEYTKKNVVPTASAICGVETEHSRLKRIKTCEESVPSY